MPLPNDKNTSALQQLTFLDDLVASERRNISDVIFRRIRDAIISGELPPGYVFPNENELCICYYSVSRINALSNTERSMTACLKREEITEHHATYPASHVLYPFSK